jgi:hypothetical protein
MAKEEAKADADGYITDGVYSYFVGTKESHPKEFEIVEQARRDAMPHGSAKDYFLERASEILRLIKDFRQEVAELSEDEFRADPLIRDATDTADLAVSMANRAGNRDSWDDHMLQAVFILGTRVERFRVFHVEHWAKAGREADDARRRGGSKSKLTDDELIRARLAFTKLREKTHTSNAAADAILKEINDGRSNAEKVSKQTIERAVGIRHK